MTIQRLSQAVADAIAAGEVVERPASVVKELVENALDAGATRVEVEIDGAGQERIVVLDDGGGIPAAELALALARHATSKLNTVADLADIRSLGFRGEALASIAAVSRLECRSTARGRSEGAVITAEFGRVGETGVAPPLAGTRIEVQGLFENTPARRAFLKRRATELAAAIRVVSALALCHPEVAFRLTADGRRVLDLPGGDAGTVLRSLLRGTPELLPVESEADSTFVAGLIGAPAESRRSREHLYLSVNRRPLVSRGLAVAIEQSFRGLVEPGRFPLGAINITTPPELLDVNVHPTKREVRFREERRLFGIVQRACLDALSRSSTYGGTGLFPGQEAAGAGGLAVAEASAPYTVAVSAGADAYSPAAAPRAVGVVSREAELGIEPSAGHPDKLLRGPYRLVGQVLNSYIVAEGPEGLVLVDQHAAHERVIYNRLVAARETDARQMQPMLVPTLLDLTPAQSAFLTDARADLSAAGVVLEEFGGASARLVAHDGSLPERGLERLALEVLDSLMAEAREVDLSRRLERTTYTVACHAAIKFGQRLSADEMQGLLRELEVADPGITCPHGRPTILEVSEAQLRRQFRRS